jgi:hypothetical protein
MHNILTEVVLYKFLLKIFILTCSFFVLNSCGKEKESDVRGTYSCHPYNVLGERCERAGFKILNPPTSFEAFTPQTISWEKVDDALTYNLSISTEEDCSDKTLDYPGLISNEQEIVIENVKSYYICLEMVLADDVIWESFNSRSQINVTESTISNLIFSNKNFDFGKNIVSQETLASIPISIKGVGSVSDIEVSGTNSTFYFNGSGTSVGTYPGAQGTCETTVVTPSSCTLVIAFKPLSAEKVEQTLTLKYFNGQETIERLLVLTGEATEASKLIYDSKTNFNFGNVSISDTIEKTVTLTNDGANKIESINPPSSLESPYSYKGSVFPGTGGTCGSELDAGQSCTFIINFTPAAPGSALLPLTINYLSGSSKSLSQSFSGTGS